MMSAGDHDGSLCLQVRGCVGEDCRDSQSEIDDPAAISSQGPRDSSDDVRRGRSLIEADDHARAPAFFRTRLMGCGSAGAGSAGIV